MPIRKLFDKIMNVRFKDLVTNITIFAIFTDAFYYNFAFYYRFKFYNVIFLLVTVLLIILLRNSIFNKSFFLHSYKPVTLFLLIVFFSLLNLFTLKTNFLSLGKQIFGILLHSLTFYLLIEYNNRDIKKLFKIYLKICFLIALYAIIQEIVYVFFGLLNTLFPIYEPLFTRFFKILFFPLRLIKTMHFFSMFGFPFLRVSSIMPEPFSFCTIMMPAFFVALTTFLKNKFKFLTKKESIVIIMAFFLSFSLMGYLGIIFSMWLFLIKKRRFVLCLISPVLFLSLAYSIFPPFRERLPFALEYLQGKRPLERTDQSTFTLSLNALVVFDIIKSGEYVFGRGLGSHEDSYYAYLSKSNITGPPRNWKWLLNRKDANSLFLRLLSETGIFGLIVFLLFIKRNYISANKDSSGYLWIINNSILILFIIRLIRQGNYFSEGFLFFIWLYYFSKQLMLQNRTSNIIS